MSTDPIGPDLPLLAPVVCLRCKKRLTGAFRCSAGGEDRPTPGAINICMGCEHIAAWTDDLQLRELTEPEMQFVLAAPPVQIALAALRAARQEHQQ